MNDEAKCLRDRLTHQQNISEWALHEARCVEKQLKTLIVQCVEAGMHQGGDGTDLSINPEQVVDGELWIFYGHIYEIRHQHPELDHDRHCEGHYGHCGLPALFQLKSLALYNYTNWCGRGWCLKP